MVNNMEENKNLEEIQTEMNDDEIVAENAENETATDEIAEVGEEDANEENETI